MTHDNGSYYAQSLTDNDYGTTHVVVLASNGDAFSVTTTIKQVGLNVLVSYHMYRM